MPISVSQALADQGEAAASKIDSLRWPGRYLVKQQESSWPSGGPGACWPGTGTLWRMPGPGTGQPDASTPRQKASTRALNRSGASWKSWWASSGSASTWRWKSVHAATHQFRSIRKPERSAAPTS